MLLEGLSRRSTQPIRLRLGPTRSTTGSGVLGTRVNYVEMCMAWRAYCSSFMDELSVPVLQQGLANTLSKQDTLVPYLYNIRQHHCLISTINNSVLFGSGMPKPSHQRRAIKSSRTPSKTGKNGPSWGKRCKTPRTEMNVKHPAAPCTNSPGCHLPL